MVVDLLNLGFFVLPPFPPDLFAVEAPSALSSSVFTLITDELFGCFCNWNKFSSLFVSLITYGVFYFGNLTFDFLGFFGFFRS